MISKSPQRHTFQKECFIKRKEEEGTLDDASTQYMIKYYENLKDEETCKENDTTWQKYNMEYDLRTTQWILEKVRSSNDYAQNLYAAMCNNDFIKRDLWPILKEEKWGCSWRSAGGIIADMRQEGDYIDWYCSGSGGLNREYEGEETNEEWQKRTGYVPESVVTEEIEKDLYKLGWVVVKYDDAKDTNI